MHLNAAALQDFYRSPLGAVARRRISRKLGEVWSGQERSVAIGLGFATPYLPVLKTCRSVGAMMPERLGAIVWPSTGPVSVALVQEERLPLADNSVDRLLVAHGLEVAEHARAMLREIWRVLAPEGRLLVIVPNRRGVWSRFEHTPFGQGHPYTKTQLELVLREAMFSPERFECALYFPPIDRRLLLRGAAAAERFGELVTPHFGGVHIVEASKQLTAPAGLAEPARGLRNLVTVRKDRSPF